MICVVGATGFLGSNLVAHFESVGHEVVQLSWTTAGERQVVSQIENLVARGNLTAVLLCGASQLPGDDHTSAAELIESNVFRPALVASVLLEKSPTTKLVHFGTSWQSGVGGRGEPFNLYAASKSASERLLEHFAGRGLPILSLRLYDTYGVGDSRRKLLNLALQTIMSGDYLETTLGEQLYELIHIQDVVQAVEMALSLTFEGSPVLQTFDVGPQSAPTVRQALELLCELGGVEAEVHFDFGARPYRSSEKMHAMPLQFIPNWAPRVSLEEGLREMLDAHRNS